MPPAATGPAPARRPRWSAAGEEAELDDVDAVAPFPAAAASGSGTIGRSPTVALTGRRPATRSTASGNCAPGPRAERTGLRVLQVDQIGAGRQRLVDLGQVATLASSRRRIGFF